MISWMLGILSPLVVALIIFLVGRCKKMTLTHREEHKLIRGLPDLLERHTARHDKIDAAISVVIRGNMQIMKDRIVSLHKKHVTAGFISVHEREVFDGMCASYFESGGNGPVKILKEEIDNLPTKV